MMIPELARRRRRAVAVLVACAGVIAVLLVSPVSLRGDEADTAVVIVAGFIGVAAAHEAASGAFRYAVLYPLVLLGPSVAACSSAMSGPQRSVAFGDNCRVRLGHEGYISSAWVTVDVAEAFDGTPFEIDRGTGLVEHVDALGTKAESGAWKPFELADLSVRRASAARCTPSLTYDNRTLPVAWGRRAR